MELVLAKSLAGHDRGEVYIVLGEDGQDVILVNGKNRTMENPKRKRKKHVQKIIHLPQELRGLAAGMERWTDEDARRIIREYDKGGRNCQKQM